MNIPRSRSGSPDRVSRYLSLGLAASLALPTGFAQSTEEFRRLQEENAALRRRVAEMEGRAAPAPQASPSATPRAIAPASTTLPAAGTTSEGITVLSPFQVNSEKDYGYLKTNSATATRIGMEIQKVPLSISVLSEDFIRDTGMREISDVMRYTASAAGDTRQGVKAPGNSATPSGSFTLRGFPVSSRLRNGLNRYSYYNMDTVDRIEVIKGPAAVFFGQGFPGGVINYVTKQPQFTPLPTTLSYSYGGNEERMGSERTTMDQNTILSKTAAMRMVAVWDDNIGSQRFEFKKAFTVAPSITVIPFADGKVRLKGEFEYSRAKHNTDGQGWLYPEQWFNDFKSPSAALLAAANTSTNGVYTGTPMTAAQYQARIFNNLGAWIQDVRRVAQGNNLASNFDANNNYVAPQALYTSLVRGAKYNKLDGTRVYDSKFNMRGPGTLADNTDSTGVFTIEADPAEWINSRLTFTKNNSTYTYLTSQAAPFADGNRMNFSGLSYRGDKRDANTLQYDFVLKKDFMGVKNKVLLGGIYDHTFYSYYGASGFLFTNIPGVVMANSGIPGTITSVSGDPTFFPNIASSLIYPNNAAGGQAASQQLYGRDGRPLTPAEVFQQYDPAIHPVPNVNRVTQIDRGLVDHQHPKKEEYYINYLATLMDDRLNLFAGYRTVNEYDADQRVDANPPWYNGFENMASVLNPAEQVANGISSAPGSFHMGTYLVKKGNSSMFGASFAATKSLTLYASFSKTYLPNTGFMGLTDENLVAIRAVAIGSTAEKEIARIRAAGSNNTLKNEEGKNLEFGVKTSMWDNKLVGTFSVFRLLRTNEKLDDSQRQIDEPLNYAGPNKSGAYGTGNGGVRWYSNSSTRKVEGTEAEIIWTPMRNYQMLANGSWLWTAKTTADPRYFEPGKAPAGATAAQIQGNNQNYYFTYMFRLPNVPEFRLNMFNRYTFADGALRGLTLTLGGRYASVMNISNDINTDSKRGGVTAGNYVVFDGGASYPWEVFGYKIGTAIQVSNLTNKDYNEGSGGLAGGGYMGSPPRTWLLTNTLRF